MEPFSALLKFDDQLSKLNFKLNSVQTLVPVPVMTNTSTHVVADTVLWISKFPTLLRMTRIAFTPNLFLPLIRMSVVLIKLKDWLAFFT